MEGIFALFETSKGTITVELTYKLTPGTVGNFVSLAEGLNLMIIRNQENPTITV